MRKIGEMHDNLHIEIQRPDECCLDCQHLSSNETYCNLAEVELPDSASVCVCRWILYEEYLNG